MPLRAALVALLALSLAGCSDPEPVSSASGSSSPSAEPTASAVPPVVEPSASRGPGPSPTAATPAPPPPTGGSPSPAPLQPQDPLSPRPGRESAAPTGQPTCRGADLTVVDADTLVLPDHVHEVFVLRTRGPDCQLEGFPAVRLLDAAGGPLPVIVERGGHGLPTDPPVPVTLSRSTSLSFVVASGRDGSCTEASAVDVTLPGTTTAIRTATVLPVCDGRAGVSPVLRRTDDE